MEIIGSTLKYSIFHDVDFEQMITFLAGIHEMYILYLNSTVIKRPLLNKRFDTRLVINTVNWLRSGQAIFHCCTVGREGQRKGEVRWVG